MTILRALSAAVLLLLAITIAPSAFADPNDSTVKKGCLKYGCRIEAKKTGPDGSDSVQTSLRRAPTDESSHRQSNTDEAIEKAQAEFDTAWAAYRRAKAARDGCLRQSGVFCPAAPTPPDSLLVQIGSFNGGGGPPVIQITPAQAGAIAVARLQLPTVAPGIGPPPDLNRWKMAAVGYPLWLWADGPTHVGPVSDSVAGLSVSLEATVTSLTFRMGDGKTVECPGVGNKWTKAVVPGAKAPRCGHTYTEPSLPKDNYTVSALTNWAVTWTANGQSGVIDVPAVQTTELPVGELQVLVR